MVTNVNSLFRMGASLSQLAPHKARTLINYRLAQANVCGSAIKEVAPGVQMELDLSDWLQRLYYLGEVDQRRLILLREHVPMGATVVDIGANVGLYSCVLANHVGQAGTVISFEPMPECLVQLHRNVEINEFNNVKIRPVALSNSVGMMELYVPPSHPGGPSGATKVWNPDDWNVVGNVQATTLDEAFHGDRLDLIKIDVEGHEVNVIEGALSVIGKFLPIILCEVSHETRNTILNYASSLRYRAFTESPSGTLAPLSQNQDRGWSDLFLFPNHEHEN